MIHEVLGIAVGTAQVRFGGDKGAELDVEAGDVAVLPAGTGHQHISATPDLMVIGAYPPGGHYDLCRGTNAESMPARSAASRACRCRRIPTRCSAPDGPLTRLWR